MPLFWLSLACVIGIWLGSTGSGTGSQVPWVWLVLGCCLAVMGLLMRAPRPFVNFPGLMRAAISLFPSRLIQKILRIRLFLRARLRFPPSIWFLAAVLCVGVWRYQSAHPLPAPGNLADYNDRIGVVWVARGVLTQPVDVRDGFAFVRVQVESLRVENNLLFFPVHGLLLARIDDRFQTSNWSHGDRVELSGNLMTPADGEVFSYKEYLAHQGIYTAMTVRSALRLESGEPDWRTLLFALRSKAQKIVFQFFPDPEASLISGILLGLERSIPASVQKAFNLTGTTHIIAISGFNITILAIALHRLFSRLFGRWQGTVLAVAGIFVYALLTGAQPSALRAAWMGSAVLVGQQIGRRTHVLNSLSAVAALMALDNPDILWDSGFQLSFAATLSLALLTTPMSAALQRILEKWSPPELVGRIMQPVNDYLLATLAAQVGVLPILFARSAQITWTALPANILILPAQPLLMIIGGLSVLAGLIWEPLGRAAAWLAWPFAAYTIRIVEFLAGQPGPRFVGSPNYVIPALIALLLLASAWLLWPAGALGKRLLARLRPGLVLLILGILIWVVWSDSARLPDGRLHLYVLDVSTESLSGDAVLIKTPGGRFILLNGGPSVTRLSDALGRRLPLSRRRLDWLVVGGVEDNQLAALPEVIQRFPPDQVLWAGGNLASPAASRLHTALVQSEISYQPAAAGQVLDLGDGGRLHVLSVGARGAIFLLEYGSFRALLPLGPDAANLEHFDPAAIGRVTVWLLAGSGYAPLNPTTWIETLQPDLVLLSVAPADYRGLPDAALLDRVAGRSLLRTDLNGWIEVQTNGSLLWTQAARSR